MDTNSDEINHDVKKDITNYETNDTSTANTKINNKDTPSICYGSPSENGMSQINSTSADHEVMGKGTPNEQILSLETSEEKRYRRRSLYISFATMFFNSVGYGMLNPSIWPYMNKLDPRITKTSYGWAMMVAPLVQLVAGPLSGYWLNHSKSIRIPMWVCQTCNILAYLSYALLYAFSVDMVYWGMVASRAFVGFSAGYVTLSRSYVASSTLLEERTQMIMLNQAAQTFGYVAGPGIQALLTVIFPRTIGSGAFQIDEYNSAGWFCAIGGVIITSLYLPICFKESYISLKEFNTSKEGSSQKGLDEKCPSPNVIGAITMVVAFGITITFESYRETLGSIIVAEEYALPNEEALFYVSTVLSVSGFVSVFLMLIIVRFVQGKVDERKFYLLAGVLPLFIISLFNQPMSGTKMNIHNCTKNIEGHYVFDLPNMNLPTYNNSIVPSNIVPIKYISNFENKLLKTPEENLVSRSFYNDTHSDSCLGCPVLEQPWCTYTSYIPVVQMIVVYSLAVTPEVITISMGQAIFAKILGPSSLGLWMSLPSSAACISRLTGALWLTAVYHSWGVTYVYVVLSSLFLISTILVVVNFKRIKPMDRTKSIES